MKRLFFAFLFLAMSCPTAAFAQTSVDVYGDAVIASSQANLLTPGNAAGVPDGHYADFRTDNTYLTIDMGEGEEGFGNLIATIRIINLGATGRATFYDANWVPLGTSGTTFAASSTTWTAIYDGATPYRYVKIESPDTDQWGLDAVQATQVNSPSVTPEPVPPTDDSIPYCTASDCGRAGQLVQAAGNSAVYFIGKDGMRHAFPNDVIFASWGYDFADVETVSASVLSSYQLGKNVTVRPGTYMVKIVHDPKTYFVEPGGVLRWVTSENIARSLYGADWNQDVIDVDEAFWKNYRVGDPITDTSIIPIGYVFGYNIGTFGEAPPGSGFYLMTSDGLRLLTDEERTALHLTIGLTPDAETEPSGAVTPKADNSDLAGFVHPY